MFGRHLLLRNLQGLFTSIYSTELFDNKCEVGNSQGRKWQSGLPTGNPSFSCTPTFHPLGQPQGTFREDHFSCVAPGLWPALGPQHHPSNPRDLPFPLPFGGPSIGSPHPFLLFPILGKRLSIKREALRILLPTLFTCLHTWLQLSETPLDPSLPSIFSAMEFSPVFQHPLLFWRLPVNGNLTPGRLFCPVNLSEPRV